MKKTSQEKRLPGLPYTPEQLFFIGASQVTQQYLHWQYKYNSHTGGYFLLQVWCQVATLTKQAELLKDVHSPSSIR